MEEWLHCNYCGVRISKTFCSFVITTCAHIFCSKCEQKATNPDCAVCHQKCKTTPLNDKIQATIAEFFKSPTELRKKAMDYLKRADEVSKFQNHQLKLLRKKEQAKFEESSKMIQGAMQTIEKLQKENIEAKKLLRNKSNISASPNASRISASHSPDISPRHSPSKSPRRPSPSHGPMYKVSSQYYSSVPCSPIKSFVDGHQHSTPLSYKSPNDSSRRLSMRSPPVDGKLCLQPPSGISPNRGHPYKSSEGIVSKQATMGAPQMSSRPAMQNYTSHLSPRPFGTTPPTTPKYPSSHGYYSCPVTPENNFSSLCSVRHDVKKGSFPMTPDNRR